MRHSTIFIKTLPQYIYILPHLYTFPILALFLVKIFISFLLAGTAACDDYLGENSCTKLKCSKTETERCLSGLHEYTINNSNIIYRLTAIVLYSF